MKCFFRVHFIVLLLRNTDQNMYALDNTSLITIHIPLKTQGCQLIVLRAQEEHLGPSFVCVFFQCSGNWLKRSPLALPHVVPVVG